MELPEVRRILSQRGIEIIRETRMPDGHGWRLECRGGEIVNVYDTGRVVAQGRRMKEVGQLFLEASSEDVAGVPQPWAAANPLIAIMALAMASLAFFITLASQKSFAGVLSPYGKFSLVLSAVGMGTAAADVAAA